MGRLTVFAAGCLMLMLAGGAQAADERVLIVQGTGTSVAAPDRAQITIGVVIVDQNARAALAEVARSVERTLKELGAAGIAETDIQTSGLSLQPLYEGGRFSGSAGTPQITGFEARNGLTVIVRDIDGLGAVLDDLVRSGTNEVNGISFEVAQPEPLMDAARAKAVAEARRKAELLAAAAGVTLGPLLELREGGGGGGPQRFARAEAMMSADVPIARGEVTLSATVTLTYQLGGE